MCFTERWLVQTAVSLNRSRPRQICEKGVSCLGIPIEHFWKWTELAMAKKNRIPHKFQPWIDARKKYHLSNAHIQMARELGMNPKRFGRYADNKDQPWKLPLAEFIEELYGKNFGKSRPEEVRSIEEMAAAHLARRAARKAARAEVAANLDSHSSSESAVQCSKVEQESGVGDQTSTFSAGPSVQAPSVNDDQVRH